ncbi:MAG TPA: ABC transporter permease, partial [Thermosipho africanus]|nr:ABC transporter permease [Thermosipho africanus]
MVVRKRNWLTHAILIILIVAILFPVVWVVSTSLRRDNAAFSSKLFSSRMSLQNYKDLLFPEDNVLRLLSDIESITTNSRPYDEKSVEFLVEKFDKDIEALKAYSKESKELISVVDNEYETIKSYLSENSDKLIQTVVEQVNKLNEKINIEKPDNNQLIGVALISLLEERKIKEKDVQELSLGFDYKDYEDVYV